MPLTEAQKRAIKNYNKKIERTTVMLPMGTRDRIKNAGAKSINSYIVNAIEKQLKEDEERLK